MKIWCEYSLDIDRYNDVIKGLASALQLSDEDLDKMLIEGAKL